MPYNTSCYGIFLGHLFYKFGGGGCRNRLGFRGPLGWRSVQEANWKVFTGTLWTRRSSNSNSIYPKPSQEYCEQVRPLPHKMTGLCWEVAQKLTRVFARLPVLTKLGSTLRNWLGNYVRGCECKSFRTEIVSELIWRCLSVVISVFSKSVHA